MRSATKMKGNPAEPKLYLIDVVCPWGWPLTLVQWQRVDEIRNSLEYTKIEAPMKKVVKDKSAPSTKPGSAKEKEKEKDKEKEKMPVPFPLHHPQPGDAYVELECAVALYGGAVVKRDDERDLEFANARKFWDAREPGRNLRGAQIRKEFRSEFLEAPPPIPAESVSKSELTTAFEETEAEEEKKEETETTALPVQGPSPVTESEMLEMTLESEEEASYLIMPDQLRDKFIPLYFLPFCMKERNEEECVLLTPDMAEAAKKDRHARIDAAIERMRELQIYNEERVLGRQKERCQLLEKLFVDAQWCPQLQEVLEERDEAIIRETLNRTLSATKKKQEAKRK